MEFGDEGVRSTHRNSRKVGCNIQLGYSEIRKAVFKSKKDDFMP